MTERLNWRIQMTVSCMFLRCFADTIIATRGENLTAWWPDCSHDINCCIFFFSKYSWFPAVTIFCQSPLYSKVTQLYTHIFFSIMLYHRLLNIAPSCFSIPKVIVCIYQLKHPSPSLFISPSPLTSTNLFSLSVSLFLSCRRVLLPHSLDSMYKCYHMVFVFLFLTYFT